MNTRSATQTTSSSTKTTEGGFSPNWPQIIKWSIIIVIFMGITKIILQLFIAAGPLWEGIADIAGAGANIVEGLTNGCSSQPDCKKTKDSNVCKNQDNCGWNAPSESGEEGTCINLTGRPSGSGGFFSTSCGLGIGFLLYISAVFLTPFLKFLASRFTKNENIETAARLETKPTDTVLKVVVEKAREATEDIKNESETDMTDAQIKLTASKCTNNESVNQVMKSVKNQKDAQEISNKAIENAAEINAQMEKQAEEEGMSKEAIDEIDDAVDKHVDPFEVLALNKMILYNVKPTPKAHAHLMKRFQKRSKVEPHHMNFLLKYR